MDTLCTAHYLLLFFLFALQNPKTRTEIECLAEEGNDDNLQKLLGKRMVFGTAGECRGVVCVLLGQQLSVGVWSVFAIGLAGECRGVVCVLLGRQVSVRVWSVCSWDGR